MGQAPEALEHAPAVDARHHEVEHDDVGVCGLDLVERFEPIRSTVVGEAPVLEHQRDDVLHVLHVAVEVAHFRAGAAP